jgi:hypothetical protein
MKYKLFFFFIIFSCTTYNNNLSKKENYTAKGFAYIYNENDYIEKAISAKMDNNIMQISHQYLKTGSLIKITNPKNKESIVLKNIKRIKYPDFYKILITKPVADKLDLKLDLPIIEIIEIKKNKSFVAKKAKIFNEEKKIPSKAPVASVEISNISKNKNDLDNKKKDLIYIMIGTFFSVDTAEFLKQRIIKDIPNLDYKKIKIRKISDKETHVISGPYISVNLLKNDYIKLKSFGFEELDIFLNE